MVDDQRFETIWRTHGASILRYCRFATGSPETGEDIAAETFARFLQKGSSVPDDKVEAWLFTVARNLCRSQQRRSSHWVLLLPMIGRAIEPATSVEYNTELTELLEPLSPNDRLAVYLRIIEDRPFSQVARLTGKSVAATKKTVYRALARLRTISQQDNPVITHPGGVEHE